MIIFCSFVVSIIFVICCVQFEIFQVDVLVLELKGLGLVNKDLVSGEFYVLVIFVVILGGYVQELVVRNGDVGVFFEKIDFGYLQNVLVKIFGRLGIGGFSKEYNSVVLE